MCIDMISMWCYNVHQYYCDVYCEDIHQQSPSQLIRSLIASSIKKGQGWNKKVYFSYTPNCYIFCLDSLQYVSFIIYLNKIR